MGVDSMYKTEMTWTPKEIRKLQYATLLQVNKWSIAVIAVLTLAMTALSAGFFNYTPLGWVLSFVITVILVILVGYLSLAGSARRQYESYKLVQKTCRMIFSEDGFEAGNDGFTTTVNFSELYRIIETKTNFYLYVSRQQAFGVVKENASEELMELLRRKM